MLVSIIVPVRNESARIEATLGCLARQDFAADEFEIIVVDGQSDDDTWQRVQRWKDIIPQLNLCANPKRLSSSARNVGIRQSTGWYVVIVDGHCEIHDTQYLKNVVAAFEVSGADCLGRPQPLRMSGANEFQRVVAVARESWLGHNPDSDIYSDQARFVPPDNVAVAYRREVFDKVGFFDEQFDACEDVEFNLRVREAGLTCYFAPSIKVDYQPRRTLRGLAYQMARYGRGRSRLWRKHPGSITLPGLVPAALLVWLMTALALSAVHRAFAVVFLATALAYLLSLTAESLRLSRRHPLRLTARAPLVFMAIHAGFGWGFLRDRLTFRRRRNRQRPSRSRSPLPAP